MSQGRLRRPLGLGPVVTENGNCDFRCKTVTVFPQVLGVFFSFLFKELQ